MQTHRLTEKLTIKELSTSATTSGLSVEVWKPIKNIYATISNQRGNLAFSNEYLGDVYTDVISFYCRYQGKLTKRKGILIEYESKNYEIINITHVSRNQATVLDLRGVQ